MYVIFIDHAHKVGVVSSDIVLYRLKDLFEFETCGLCTLGYVTLGFDNPFLLGYFLFQLITASALEWVQSYAFQLFLQFLQFFAFQLQCLLCRLRLGIQFYLKCTGIVIVCWRSL